MRLRGSGLVGFLGLDETGAGATISWMLTARICMWPRSQQLNEVFGKVFVLAGDEIPFKVYGHISFGAVAVP